jgi:hypothetical protein
VKKFEFIVTIYEGCDEFWDELKDERDFGAGVVKSLISGSIDDMGFGRDTVTVKSFSWEPDSLESNDNG